MPVCVRTRPFMIALASVVALGFEVLGGGKAECSAPEDLAQNVDDYLSRAEAFGYSGVYLVALDGRVILRKGYGLADRGSGAHNSPDTIFDVGSLAKQFTAVAILQLQEAGKLALGDPIAERLTGVPEDKRAITIEQLLTHTSGLRGDMPLGPGAQFGYYELVPRDEAVARILGTPLTALPGAAFSYSNAGYTLLAAIVERVSGEPFPDYLRSHLFAVAGMDHTGFWGAGIREGAPIARGYDDVGEAMDLRSLDAASWADRGAGGVTSTADDLYRWHLALAGDRILSAESKERLFTPHLGDYGYGWFIQKSARGERIIQHGGDLVGFGAQFTWLPDRRTLLIGLCNITFDDIGTRHRVDRAIRRMVLGEPYTDLPVIRRNHEGWEGLPGTYKLPSGGALTVFIGPDGLLRVGARGEDAAELVAPGTPAEIQRRRQMVQSVEEWVTELEGDGAPDQLARSCGPGGLDFASAVRDEYRATCAAQGSLVGHAVLGTIPSGQPIGGLTTTVQIRRQTGVCYYEFKVTEDGIVAATDVRAPEFAVQIPIARANGDTFMGWDLVRECGFELTFDHDAGAVVGLTIRSGEQTQRATKQ